MSLIDRVLGRAARAPVPVSRVEPALTQKAAASTSGTANPSAAFWGPGWGSQSRVKSLPHVTAVTAQRHATVFACCNVIAGDLSKCPLMVMQRGKDGTERQVFGHPLDYLLNTEASPGVPAMVARFALVYAYALRGRSYGYAPRDGAGEVTLIDAINPDQCSELTVSGLRGRVYDFVDGAGVTRRVGSRSMAHLRYMAQDGWSGRSPIEVAAESMGLALAGQEAAARAASGTQMRAYIKMADTYEDDEAFQRNGLRIKRSIEDPDANGLPILGATDEIVSLDLKASDQELLASRRFDREMIVSIYRVPPNKVGILEHGVKANGPQQSLDWKTDGLLHWGGFAESQLSLALLTEGERRQGLFLRHDYEGLLVATTAERWKALRDAIGGPFMLVEEGRRYEGLPELGPKDPRPYPPPNMTRDDAPKPEGKDT